VYGIPAGMYASQVWGSVYLSEGSEFGSQLQKRHLCSLRRILGVKNSTTNWAVFRECGQEPLQFFWFRASIRFFNSMLDSNSETLRRVLKADLHLASFDSSCWSAQVSNAFINGLQSSAMFKQEMLRATQVPMQEFICDLRFRHLKVWREADLVGNCLVTNRGFKGSGPLQSCALCLCFCICLCQPPELPLPLQLLWSPC